MKPTFVVTSYDMEPVYILDEYKNIILTIQDLDYNILEDDTDDFYKDREWYNTHQKIIGIDSQVYGYLFNVCLRGGEDFDDEHWVDWFGADEDGEPLVVRKLYPTKQTIQWKVVKDEAESHLQY